MASGVQGVKLGGGGEFERGHRQFKKKTTNARFQEDKEEEDFVNK